MVSTIVLPTVASADALLAALGREPSSGTVPASFLAVPAVAVTRAAMTAAGWDPDAPTLRHVLLDVRGLQPVAFDEPVTMTVGATTVGRLGRGAGLACTITAEQGGRSLADVTVVVQDQGRPPGSSAEAAGRLQLGAVRPVDPSIPASTQPLRFRLAEVLAYLELAGDLVAIHHDADVARAHGLDRPIVPGILLAAGMVEATAARWPAAVSGFTVRFRQPVFVDEEVVLHSRDEAGAGSPVRLALQGPYGAERVRGMVHFAASAGS